MTPIERAARALCHGDPDQIIQPAHQASPKSDGPRPLWHTYVPTVRAVIAAIREPIVEASVYLKADADAWESGAKGAAHETYLMHCGKLRRDIAASLDAMLEEGK